MSKYIFILTLLFFTSKLYSQDSNILQSENITIERLTDIISTSLSTNKVNEVGIKQIDIYVLLDSCVYVYNSDKMDFNLYMKEDLNEELGNKDMSVGIIYVAHSITPQKTYNEIYLSGCLIANNIERGLRKEKLSIISREQVDKKRLADLLKLKANQGIMISQIIKQSA